GVAGELRAHGLQHHGLVEHAVPGPVDHAHAALAEQAEDLVALGDDRALGDGEALAAGEAALGGGVVLGVAGRTLQEATLAAAFGGPTVRSLSRDTAPSVPGSAASVCACRRAPAGAWTASPARAAKVTALAGTCQLKSTRFCTASAITPPKMAAPRVSTRAAARSEERRVGNARGETGAT